MRQTEWDGFRSPKERAGTLPNSSLPPPDPGTVEDLLARALRQRDEAAFDALLDRLHSPMLRLARVYVRSREDAEEVVQDSWLAALAGIDRFQGRSSLKTWLFRILVYRARTRGRREARTVPFSALAASAEGGPGRFREDGWIGETPRAGTERFLSESMHRASSGPEDALLAAELRHRIESAIGRLPARQREVVTLRDLEGWSAEEACELLGLTEANQRVLLHRARVRVRDAIVPYVAASGGGDAFRTTCRVRVSDRPPQRLAVAGVKRSGSGRAPGCAGVGSMGFGRAPGCAGVGLRLRRAANDAAQRSRAPAETAPPGLAPSGRNPSRGVDAGARECGPPHPPAPSPPRAGERGRTARHPFLQSFADDPLCCRASSSLLFIPGGMRSAGIAARRSMAHRIRRSCRRHPGHARR